MLPRSRHALHYTRVIGSLSTQTGPSEATAGDPGGGVQDPVAQGFRLGAGEAAVQGEQHQPGQQGRGGEGSDFPGLVHDQRGGGVLTDTAVFACADGVLEPGRP